MSYTPPEGVTIGSFTADTLPASFSAPADAVVTYKIYGTSEGAGVETENLFDYTSYFSTPFTSYDQYFDYNNIQLAANTTYTLVTNFHTGHHQGIRGTPFIATNSSTAPATATGGLGDDSTVTITTNNDGIIRLYIRTARGVTEGDLVDIPTLSDFGNGKWIKIVQGTTYPSYKIPISNTSGEQQSNYDLFIGSTKLEAEEYVDYAEQKIYRMSGSTLVPTDPPAPLPAINTYKGENTLSSTETLGDVEFTGEWTAIMGSTEDESIDIGFTVEAEEYIAHVTIDDGPSIQVSDTITMPSSADSFTLDAVAWGRERYTDTVYNALS